MDSILDSTKKILGIEPTYTAFDIDIIMNINGVLSTLQQLGIGPAEGFSIADNTATWDQFLGLDPRLNNVKTYVFLRVRALFDPPNTAYLVTSMNEQIRELEWRLNVTREGDAWTDPTTSTTSSSTTV